MDLHNQIYSEARHQSLAYKVLTTIPSYFFFLMVFIRKVLYGLKLKKRKHLPGLVISVGNIAVGGTGKTPVTIELCRHFCEKNLKVAILTRGYRSGLSQNEFAVILSGKIVHTNIEKKNIYADEAFLQSQLLKETPIIVGVNRYQAAQKYLKHFNNTRVDVWVLDDGFQHLDIQRHYDILLLDASSPFGSRHMLPRGCLREPVNSLARASAILFTRANNLISNKTIEEVRNFAKSTPIFQVPFGVGQLVCTKTHTLVNAQLLSENNIVIVGIARPNQFLESLKQVGIKWKRVIILKDHEKIDFNKLSKNIETFDHMITTAKDYWRNPKGFDRLPILTYILNLNIHIPQEFYVEIDQSFLKES